MENWYNNRPLRLLMWAACSHCCLRGRGRLAPGRGLLRGALGGARSRQHIGCAQNGTTVRGSGPDLAELIGAAGWPGPLHQETQVLWFPIISGEIIEKHVLWCVFYITYFQLFFLLWPYFSHHFSYYFDKDYHFSLFFPFYFSIISLISIM